MKPLLYTYLYILLELMNYLLTYLVIFRAKMKERKRWLLWLVPIFLIIYVVIHLQGHEVAQHTIELLGICIPFFVLQGKKQKWLLLYPAAIMLPSLISACISFVLAIVAGVSSLSVIYDTKSIIICEVGSLGILVLIGLYERWKKWESIEVKFHIKQYFVLYGGIISAVILVGCAQELSAPENLSIKEKNGFGFAIVIICILFMFLWLWNSIIAYHQEQYRHQIERLNEHLEMQENQIKTVIQSDEKLRAYRHDMKAHLLALQALCEEEETQNDRFKRYVDEIIQTSEIFHKISFTGNTAIDAVLSRLNETAIASDIQISYECTLMEKLPITLFELCTILFNLIQNAIEACEKNQEGKEISVTMYPFGDRLYIVVKNSVENDVQIEQERLITSKTDKKNHGIGSRNVRLVTQKYNGALNYFCENGWFSAEILI